jgi:hypothetical protein
VPAVPAVAMRIQPTWTVEAPSPVARPSTAPLPRLRLMHMTPTGPTGAATQKPRAIAFRKTGSLSESMTHFSLGSAMNAVGKGSDGPGHGLSALSWERLLARRQSADDASGCKRWGRAWPIRTEGEGGSDQSNMRGCRVVMRTSVAISSEAAQNNSAD